MSGDVFTFIVGGKAGEGVKKAGTTAANMFAGMGRHVFQMDDYPSLIRGGHNFVSVSTATRPVTSHYMKAELVVVLDERSYEAHRGHVGEGGVIVYDSDVMGGADGVGVPITSEAAKYPNPDLRAGLSGPAALCATAGFTRDDMAGIVEREYKRDLESNIAFASAVYRAVSEQAGGRFSLEAGGGAKSMLTGNQAIALGAAAAGLDVYLGYPMTPATSILHYLAANDRELGVTVVHPESEIAVANMAVGAAAVGARVMVGTSGGGFALMEEAFSFAGMAEAPFLSVLSSRPGPSTGVPTYTEQADLRFALGQGHGDFTRLVASPGSIEEAFVLAAEMLSLVWAFQAQGILLTEKHLSESRMTVEIDVGSAAWAEPVMHDGGEYQRYSDAENGVSPLMFPPSDELIKWNSYEHDAAGITTEVGGEIARMHDKRVRKTASLTEHLRGLGTVNRFGHDGPLVFTYGSTTLSVLEALKTGGLEARVVQPVYLEPFPLWELEKYGGEEAIVIEQSATGQFATLLAERAGVCVRGVIKRYDGRPFDPEGLAAQIAETVG